jgi:TrmH family RNA methyltransferase
MTLTRTRFKELRALSQKKVRESEGLFVVEGFRVVREAEASQFQVVEVLHTGEVDADPEGAALLARLRRRCAVTRLTGREMDAIADTRTAQGIVAVVRRRGTPDSPLQGAGHGFIVALDAVSDPGNAGAIIRTCDWFGADAVVLGLNSVELYNPKVIRATAGSIFHLPIVDGIDLPPFLETARTRGYTVLVTDLGGTEDPDSVSLGGRSIMVLGNEAWGVCEAVRRQADARVRIPRFGAAESLNVAVAAGVLLSAFRRRRGER